MLGCRFANLYGILPVSPIDVRRMISQSRPTIMRTHTPKLVRLARNQASFTLGGWLLRHTPKGLRQVQHLTLATAVSAIAAAGLTIGTTRPALAEFEIQESEVEKGEVELEYRGAVHWGVPKAGKEQSGEDGDEEAQEPFADEEEAALRQSHDFEFQWGISDRWLLSTALTADQPDGGDFNLSSVELEAQYELIEREGNGIGLAFQAAYGFATLDGEADEIEFGPIVELASRNLLITFNPLFTAQVGDNANTDGLGFDYGWRAEYDFAKNWGVGVEMFGEIEDLANTGSFNNQNHSIGPTLFYNLENDESDDRGEKNENDNPVKVLAPTEMAISLNVGVQFGLTDVTSDTALKFQGSIDF